MQKWRRQSNFNQLLRFPLFALCALHIRHVERAAQNENANLRVNLIKLNDKHNNNNNNSRETQENF